MKARQEASCEALQLSAPNGMDRFAEQYTAYHARTTLAEEDPGTSVGFKERIGTLRKEAPNSQARAWLCQPEDPADPTECTSSHTYLASLDVLQELDNMEYQVTKLVARKYNNVPPIADLGIWNRLVGFEICIITKAPSHVLEHVGHPY